jgi:hypothetical protein
MAEPGCGHTGSAAGRVCPHLAAELTGEHVRRFTGTGVVFDLLCPACARDGEHGPLRSVCAACFQTALDEGSWNGVAGTPQVRERPTGLSFVHETVGPLHLDEPFLDIRPVRCLDRQLWVVVDRIGRLLRLDLDEMSGTALARLGDAPIDLDEPVALHLSADGRFAAVVNARGRHGAVVDLEAGATTMSLDRGDYRVEHSNFPAAFAAVDGRTVLVHGTDWNRLDVSDPRTGELLTARTFAPYERGGPRPDHYLDYFYGGLAVSPDGRFVAEDGWVWSPTGAVIVWDLHRWLRENPWESEDGPSRRSLCWRDYFWDGPLCWVGNDRLAVWGYGTDDEWLVPAVRVFDAASGREAHWFAGPRGEMAFDGVLFSTDVVEATSVWDVDTGERLLRDAAFCPHRYHPGAKTFLTPLPGGHFRITRLRRPKGLAGRGFDDGTVIQLARGIRAANAFDGLPVLADALEEAGCTDAAVLAHCRAGGPHAGRCWVVDLILGASEP